MVLLHHHVVPGFSDDLRPAPEATAVRGDQVAPVDCDELALAAAPADPASLTPSFDTICAA
jgi:hypothetical protein